MKKIIALLLLTGVLTLTNGVEFEKLLADQPENIWQSDAGDIAGLLGIPLVPGDSAGSFFRYYSRRSPEKLTIAGINVEELIVRLKSGKVDELELSIHNRGDAPNVMLQHFHQDQQKIEEFIARRTSGLQNDRTWLNGATIEMRWGRSPYALWMLSWCENQGRGEYLRLRILPPDRQPDRLKSTLRASTDGKDLASRVIKDANGDCYLPVPMIDQGGKGYCVAATVARIMRYYGAELDQNTIAQLASTDIVRGTTWSQFLPALEQAQSRLKVRVVPLVEARYFDSANGVMQFVSEYNNIARKEKLPTLRMDDLIVNEGGYQIIRMDKVFTVPDPEIVAKLRMRDRNGFKKFKETLIKAIDQGYPVIWCIPSHMRIINGYNQTENTVIYTDSAGAGHEKKSMPMDDAWVRTIRTLLLEPTR